MKRVLVLAGLPLALLLVWGAERATSRDAATVDVTAQDPTELRGSVIARLAQLGGVRIGERSSFTGSGQSELRFRVPTARLEEAMIALDSLGGTVTNQEVDLSSSREGSAAVTNGIDELQRCLDGMGDALRTGAAAAQDRLATCRATADRVDQELDGATVDLDESELLVRITPVDHTNPLLAAAIVILLLAAVGLTVMVWRSSRLRPEVDLRDLGDFPNFDDDAFLRRN